MSEKEEAGDGEEEQRVAEVGDADGGLGSVGVPSGVGEEGWSGLRG